MPHDTFGECIPSRNRLPGRKRMYFPPLNLNGKLQKPHLKASPSLIQKLNTRY